MFLGTYKGKHREAEYDEWRAFSRILSIPDILSLQAEAITHSGTANVAA